MKKINILLSLLFALVVGFSFTSCSDDDETAGEDLTLKQITFNYLKKTIELNQPLQLKVSFLPLKTTDTTVTLASSNPSVATIDQNGNITTLSVGKTDITAVSKSNSSIVATCVLTVTDQTIAIQSLDFDFKALGAVEDGGEYYLKVNIGDQIDLKSYLTVLPDSPTEEFSIATDDENAFVIDENNVVTVTSAGSSYISCTNADGSIETYFYIYADGATANSGSITVYKNGAVASVAKVNNIQKCSFIMGYSNSDKTSSVYKEDAPADQCPAHYVNLSEYTISDCITNGMFYEVTGQYPVITVGNDSVNGVALVDWTQISKFVSELNIMLNANYDNTVAVALPTEAQWQNACKTLNYTNLDNYEWCSDWYAFYTSGEVTDPTGPESGAGKVVRGGSYIKDDVKVYYDADYRSQADPSMLYAFRIVY